MLRINSFLAVLSFSALQLAGQPQFELSRNVYRVPYSNGITVTVNNDHYTHDPLGRYDLKGSGFGGSCGVAYPIVAAAEGIIRRIVDNNNVHGPDCSSNCTQYNNYVWIEHANGEWTKYSHMKYQSTTIDAGLSVGDQVCAGTFLGYECDIELVKDHLTTYRENSFIRNLVNGYAARFPDKVVMLETISSQSFH